jgi:hypothetical protein
MRVRGIVLMELVLLWHYCYGIIIVIMTLLLWHHHNYDIIIVLLL